MRKKQYLCAQTYGGPSGIAVRDGIFRVECLLEKIIFKNTITVMKIRTIAFACMAAFATSAMAQFEGATIDERIAATAGEDSVVIGRGHITSFQMGIDCKNWQDAHISWKWLMKNAPFAISGLYKGHDPFML